MHLSQIRVITAAVFKNRSSIHVYLMKLKLQISCGKRIKLGYMARDEHRLTAAYTMFTKAKALNLQMLIVYHSFLADYNFKISLSPSDYFKDLVFCFR